MLNQFPVEILYLIQLYALSPSLPFVSKHINLVYNSAPSSFHADYIIARVSPSDSRLTHILRYPLCTIRVLDALSRRAFPFQSDIPDLPRRLFRHLTPREWTNRDHPLPFLIHLYALRKPNTNAHNGYALIRAVHAHFIPLVRFLLDHGADAACNGRLAVKLAIRHKDLALLRMLVEREESGGSKGKRRRMEDRLPVDPEMVREAVKCDARDIVEYLTKEKGCVPDMRTLHMMAVMAVNAD